MPKIGNFLLPKLTQCSLQKVKLNNYCKKLFFSFQEHEECCSDFAFTVIDMLWFILFFNTYCFKGYLLLFKSRNYTLPINQEERGNRFKARIKLNHNRYMYLVCYKVSYFTSTFLKQQQKIKTNKMTT